MKTQEIMMLAAVGLLVYLAWQARPASKTSSHGGGPQYLPAWSGASDYYNSEDWGWI